MNVEKKIINCFAKNTFSVSEGVLLKPLKFFFDKLFIDRFFFYSRFLFLKSTDVVTKR